MDACRHRPVPTPRWLPSFLPRRPAVPSETTTAHKQCADPSFPHGLLDAQHQAGWRSRLMDLGQAAHPRAREPRPGRGVGFTPLAAGDSPSTHGPSWRMVVDWGTKTFSGIYPGGQSENPASTWYENKVDAWWSGLYAPMLSADQASFAPGVATWSMQP